MTSDVSTVGASIGPPDHRWEALRTGDRLSSTGLTVTDAHIVGFAGLTGDIVSFHLDDERARHSEFGQRVAHGPFTVSASLGLLTQTGYFNNVVAWLGLDEVRAKQPVLVGDTISVRAQVREARPTRNPRNGVWTIDYTVVNQRDETVMTFTSAFLVRRRDEEGTFS